ncbi:MAG: hypothetical protein R6U62_02845 [Bacteroidales bacterium]
MRLFLFILIVLIITPLVYPDAGVTKAYPFEEEHRERVFVHADRDFYVAGEYINYHVYLLDGQPRETRSGFVYLALRRADKVVERVTIPLEQGHASGSIYLSDTLSTGQYGLTAYTNWMRNQGENSYFNKPVSIVNRFDDEPLLHLNEAVDIKKPDLSFTAEGGHFIEGINNNILVKTNIQSGPERREVWIRNIDKDTIAHTYLDIHGMGVVTIQPEPGNVYHAIIQGEREEFPLPRALGSGCALNISQENNMLSVHILQPAEAGAVDMFHIKQHDVVLYEESVNNHDQIVKISLEETGIPSGFLSLEAVDRDGQVIGRRLWYNEAAETSGISLSTNKDTTGTRESVQLTLDATAMKDGHANVSLAVVPEASVNKGHIRFDGYIRALRLADKFGIPASEAYTRVAGMDVETLNRYLITLSDSGTQPESKKNTISANAYYMETDKLILCGQVVDRASNQAVSGARIVINTPDTLINLLYTESHDDGSFYFVLPEFYHNKPLYFYADPASVDVPVNIKPEGKFTFHDSFRHSMSPMPANRPEYLKQSQEIVRINKAFDIDHMVVANQDRGEAAIPPLLYSRANQTIDLDNYFALDSLREIASEIVHSWRLRLSGGEYVSQLISANTGKTLPGSPVHFVDGIITGDIHKMAKFDSGDIDKIEIHNYHWVHGEMVFPGIIGIFTEDQRYAEIVDDRTSTSLFSESLQDKLIHTAPDYGPETSHPAKKPDFRQLLYWETGLELINGEQRELTFYTGDLGGDYMIILQGLNENGHPVYQTKSINVQR